MQNKNSTPYSEMLFLLFGGEAGIRTLARLTTSNDLANRPLRPAWVLLQVWKLEVGGWRCELYVGITSVIPSNILTSNFAHLISILAERVRFELTVASRLRRFSRPVP